MATYYHPSVFDGGLDYLIAQASALRLVNGYNHGDDYATIAAATVASMVISAASWVKSDITNGRQARLPSGLPMGNATGNASGDLHWAITRESDQTVLHVVNGPDTTIVSGNPVDTGIVDVRFFYAP